MSWAFITGFGDAYVLLPLALLLAAGLGLETREGPRALRFLMPLAAAACVVTLTKVLFLGFGWGSAVLDFTGASGHAMLSFAVYPLLAFLVAGPSARGRAAWLGGACAFAALIAASRVAIGVHSVSEILAGAALGACSTTVAVMMLRQVGELRLSPLWASPLLAVLLVSHAAPAVPALPTTHGLVSQLALGLSGRAVVYTRFDLHLRSLASRPTR